MYADLIQENATVTGTGPITLAGNVTGWRKFSDAFGSGKKVRYFIQNETRLQWEFGIGTVTIAGPDVLTREQVVRSSNANNLVNFDDSAKTVICPGDADSQRFGASPAPVATGTKNARIVAYDPPLTALIDGHIYAWINGDEANDDETTVDLGPGETDVVRPDGTALLPKDMPADALILAKYVADDDALRLLAVNETAASVVLGGTISPGSLSASQNDWNPTGWAGASIIRVTSSVAVDLTGLAGGRAGRVAIVQNIGANVETLKNESSSSTAANRFALGGSDLALAGGASALLIYDGTSSRWRLIASSRGSSGSIGGTETSTAGEDLADRDVAYQDIHNQRGGGATKWYKVDTDATGPVKISERIGIVLAAIASGATGLIQVRPGRIDGFTSLTAGVAVWASATAGAVTQTAPAEPSSGTQCASRLIGVAASTTEIDFQPYNATTFIGRNSALAVDGTVVLEHFPDAGARERRAGAYLVASTPSQISWAGATITRSSNQSGGGNEVDGNTSTQWFGNTSSNEWSNAAFGTPVTPIKVEFWPGQNSSPGDRVAGWELRGSNNGWSSYTTLASGTEAGSDSWQSATFANVTAYADIRFHILSTDGGSAAGLKEWRIFAAGVTRAEPVRIGSWTIDAAKTDCMAVKFADASDANADTRTTFKNRMGATYDTIVTVTL